MGTTARKVMNLTQAARALRLKKPYLYGILMAYGIVPVQGARTKPGRPPMNLTLAQVESIRARLKSAGVTAPRRAGSSD
jgi:hypothetical protein